MKMIKNPLSKADKAILKKACRVLNKVRVQDPFHPMLADEWDFHAEPAGVADMLTSMIEMEPYEDENDQD